jgi:hypothetical protein
MSAVFCEAAAFMRSFCAASLTLLLAACGGGYEAGSKAAPSARDALAYNLAAPTSDTLAIADRTKAFAADTFTVDTFTVDQVTVPQDAARSVKAYGAIGDGITDDTEAIQRALDDGRRVNGQPVDAFNAFFGRTKALLFPRGTYLVSRPLSWYGCCVTLQGEGPGVSVIRLKDNAAAFQDAAAPQPVLRTPDNNQAFRQNVFDLAIRTGAGNPGAIALAWMSSNTGALRNVRLISDDGAGVRGLDMSNDLPGPCLVKNVFVRGFDIGIHLKNRNYGPTFEGIALEGQRRYGFLNESNSPSIRLLRSNNRVPAIRSQNNDAAVVLLDAWLMGGASESTALQIDDDNDLFMRNVRVQGYGSVLSKQSQSTGQFLPQLVGRPLAPGQYVDIYTAFAPLGLFPTAGQPENLGLPHPETPMRYDGRQVGEWQRVANDNQTEVQRALDAGKPVVYFPFGVQNAIGTVRVPAHVQRIVGFSSTFNGGGIRFVVDESSTEPLIIEDMGYGVQVEHHSGRTLVLKSGNFGYSSQPGAGDLYLEDVGLGPLTVRAGQRVWARQWNNEADGTKIVVDGGQLWVLGLKTENPGLVIEARHGALLDLLGGVILPVNSFPQASGDPSTAFVLTDSRASLVYSRNASYTQWEVVETRSGQTRRLSVNDTPARMPLYIGH